MNRRKPKCVLVNPWVYDFSALNLWSRPLGLLRTAEYLSQFDVDLYFIDCMDELKTERKFGTGKYSRQIIEKPEVLRGVPRNYARYGISLDRFEKEFRACLPCDLVLVSSIMTYWYPGVQKVIEIVKRIAPEVPVVLGGIYATLFHEHAVMKSGADYVFDGQVSNDPSERLKAVVERFGWRLNREGPVRPYYELGLYRSYAFAPLLTAHGCPYRCSYCASSILSGEFVQRDPAVIVREISALHDAGVRDFAFYDDALLVNADAHLTAIIKSILSSEMKVRFHCPNGIHARYINDEIAWLMKESGFTTLRLSLETVNVERQMNTGGKVTCEVLQKAVGALKKCGFRKDNIGIYVMYGLPGQSFSEVRDSVNFVKGLGVRVNLTEFSPIPQTECWNELKNTGKISDDFDPLLTNNSVFSLLFSDYGPANIEALKRDVRRYNSQR
jgi:radical SAM superfamily enzyme YgiQ (UPF0313 family)